MNIEDFRYVWRGKPLQTLVGQEADILAPIDIRGSGHGRALLLLHGFSSSPAVFRHLLPALTGYDAVICPVLPGHGESIQAFSAVKASEWLSAAEKTCEALIKEYKEVDVLGLSLGGLLACHLSQRFALHHLYLLAPALELQVNVPWSLKCAQVLHWLGFNYLRNRAGNLCSKLYSELAYRKLPIPVIIQIFTLIKEFKFVPPTCSMDLFLGRFDGVINSALVEKYFINLPNCKIHWLPDSAHVLPLDHDLDVIIECIQANT